MSFHFPIALPWAALACALAWPAHAETGAPELHYESAFEGYQAYSNPEIKDWSGVNQLVGEIGGWRVYAREPHVVKPAQSTVDVPEASPSAAQHPHGGKP
jgi:hypothetical protein